MTFLRRTLLALAWLAALVGVGLLVLYAYPEVQLTQRPLALASAFITWGVVVWAFTLVGFLLGLRGWARLLAALPLIALIVQIGWARPYWPHEPPHRQRGPPTRCGSSR